MIGWFSSYIHSRRNSYSHLASFFFFVKVRIFALAIPSFPPPLASPSSSIIILWFVGLRFVGVGCVMIHCILWKGKGVECVISLVRHFPPGATQPNRSPSIDENLASCSLKSWEKFFLHSSHKKIIYPLQEVHFHPREFYLFPSFIGDIFSFHSTHISRCHHHLVTSSFCAPFFSFYWTSFI